MGKKCDLCGGVARMFCESDQASLCWDCDGKVHGANFLVAKHTRCLLCSACQSPTPWKATGLRLGPTFSVCDSCVALKNAAAGASSGVGVNTNRNFSEEVSGSDYEEDRRRENDGDGAESYDEDEDEDEDEEYSDEDEDEDEDEEEEAENQVVPWAAAAQPPPVVSSSSSDGGGGYLAAKRTRENSDLHCSDDEIGCSSAQESNYSPPLKRPSRDEHALKSTAVIHSIFRLEKERTFNGADTSSSSSLIFARDFNR